MLTRRNALTLIDASLACSGLCGALEEDQCRRQPIDAINSHDPITLGHILPPPDDEVVIGADSAIGDDPARRFAVSLYRALLHRESNATCFDGSAD